MNKQIYTITELSEELNQARQNVRRRLIKLNIQAINEDDREYKTDPLEYDYQALVSLAEDFGVVLRTSFSTTNEQASTTKDQANEQAKIEVLKDQLEHERDQNKKLSKLNENLLNQLDKNQTLLDQQQRLSLNNINNIKMLESELEEKKEEKEEKETKWYNIFKRKK